MNETVEKKKKKRLERKTEKNGERGEKAQRERQRGRRRDLRPRRAFRIIYSALIRGRAPRRASDEYQVARSAVVISRSSIVRSVAWRKAYTHVHDEFSFFVLVVMDRSFGSPYVAYVRSRVVSPFMSSCFSSEQLCYADSIGDCELPVILFFLLRTRLDGEKERRTLIVPRSPIDVSS